MLRRGTGHLPCPVPGSGAPATHAGTMSGQPVRLAAARVAHQWRRGETAPAAKPVSQPRVKPREPPFKLAFFIRPSYWCDIRCAWICAVKSITTTTTISSEVPPK